MKIQLEHRRAALPSLAILAAVLFIGVIIIVLLFPDVAEWIQETLQIIFG